VFTFGDRQCVDPDTLYSEFAEAELPTELFAGKANSFTVRAGDTPSGGYLLLRQEDYYSFTMSKSFALEITDHLSHTIRFVGLWIVSAVRVAGGATDDPASVFLVEIADSRRRLNMVPISKAYNIRPADGSAFYSATRNSGSDWTWTTLTTDLWNAVGGLGSWPGFPSTLVLPAAAPENLYFYGSYALPSLVLVLNRLGAQLRHDNTTDTFSIVRIGDGTDSTYFTSWAAADPKFDGLCETPDAANRPEKIRVRFHRFPAPTAGTDPFYTVDVALSTSTGVLAGSVVIVDDDMSALGATGTPTNSSSLATRAAERAADWERRYTKAAKAKVVQYREYLSDARKAVGERRDAAVFEDTGDGYTTESFSVTSPLFEVLRFYADPPTGSSPPAGSLSTRNLDNTQIGTTTDMRFNQARGIKKIKDSPAAGQDTIDTLSVSGTQIGVVDLSAQTLGVGPKKVPGTLYVTDPSDVVTPPTYSFPVTIVYSGTDGASGVRTLLISSVQVDDSGQFSGLNFNANKTVSGDNFHSLKVVTKGLNGVSSTAAYKSDGTLWSSNVYVGIVESNNGPGSLCLYGNKGGLFGIRFQDTLYSGSSYAGSPQLDLYVNWLDYQIRQRVNLLCDTGATHGGRRGGTDYYGADTIFSFTVGTTTISMRFVAGHFIDSWTTTPPSPPSPPTPPVPISPPPAPPAPALGMLFGSASFVPSFLPVTGRTVTLTGPTSGTTTTDGAGGYSFFPLATGSYTVTIAAASGELCSCSVDGGAGTSSFSGSFTVTGSDTHTVGFVIDNSETSYKSVTVNVVNETLGGVGVAGRSVVVAGRTGITDSLGQVTFTGIPVGVGRTASTTPAGGESCAWEADTGDSGSGSLATFDITTANVVVIFHLSTH